MAKINKTYKPGDEFTPDSVNEIIAAVNENTLDLSSLNYLKSNIQTKYINPSVTYNTGFTACIIFYQKARNKYKILGCSTYNSFPTIVSIFGDSDETIEIGAGTDGKVIITNNKSYGINVVCFRID